MLVCFKKSCTASNMSPFACRESAITVEQSIQCCCTETRNSLHQSNPLVVVVWAVEKHLCLNPIPRIGLMDNTQVIYYKP